MASKPTASRWDLLALLMTALVIALVIAAVGSTLSVFVFKPKLEQYEFTRKDRERLRARIEWLSSVSESAEQRTISLWTRTRALKPPPGTNPQQFALASALMQLDQITKMLEEQKAQQTQMTESLRETNDLVRGATLDLAIRNLSDRINATEKKQLTKWDVAVVILQLMAGLGIVLGGVTYFARIVRKE